ncbi:MAG: hypothetical protein U0271_06475 [Polyangiaceae bacterium]
MRHDRRVGVTDLEHRGREARVPSKRLLHVDALEQRVADPVVIRVEPSRAALRVRVDARKPLDDESTRSSPEGPRCSAGSSEHGLFERTSREREQLEDRARLVPERRCALRDRGAAARDELLYEERVSPSSTSPRAPTLTRQRAPTGRRRSPRRAVRPRA